MPIEKEVTVTREVTETITETKVHALAASHFTVRANGPDAGEIFGRTEMRDKHGAVIDAFDWVVPKEQVLAAVVPSGLYAAMKNALYNFPQVTTPPQA